MRRTVRVFHDRPPEQRLGRAIATLPPSARGALAVVAARDDLPLVAGTWERDGGGGCLVANVVRTLAAGGRRGASGSPLEMDADAEAQQTLDLRVLSLLPELSSRDLNRLIVAWDEAAVELRRPDDAALRTLLRDALAVAALATETRDALHDARDPRARGVAGDGGRGTARRAAAAVAR